MLYFVVVVGAVVVGWNEPLKYRFMSRAEIDALEHPAPPPPVAIAQPTPSGAWMHEGSRRTSLDRDSFNNFRSSVPRPAVTPYPNPISGR